MRRATVAYGYVARVVTPSLRVEKRLLREGCTRVVCVDEVGRGALAGPASVGAVVIDATVKRPLTGVRDSKLLSAAAREALVPRIGAWAAASSVGHASPDEIDEHGILTALRLAGRRAIASLDVAVDVVLLDGNHDWLTIPEQAGLFDPSSQIEVVVPRVVMMVKADQSCSGVAAASVLAKVERDAHMAQLAAQFPEYGWDVNKGYASPAHMEALRTIGPSEQHRRSWNLPPMAE